MKLQENIDKVFWSFADKVLFIAYGFVTLFQIKALEPSEYGLYSILIAIFTFIFAISDALTLNNLIQFGAKKEERPKVNSLSFISHFVLTMGLSGIFFLFRNFFSNAFNEPGMLNIAWILPLLTLLNIPKTMCIKLSYRDYKLKELFFIDFAFFSSMTLATIYYIFGEGRLNFEKMAIIYIIGSIAGSLAGIILNWENLKFGLKGEIRIKTMFKFSFPLTLYSILHAVPKQLDILIIKLFFPTSTVGIYNSAKLLYRIFEDGASAAYGLVYPSAVKQIEKGDRIALKDLITKSVSFMLISYGLVVILIQIGLGDLLIRFFLPVKYHFAIGQFEMLSIGALAIPLVVLSLVITAEGKPNLVLLYVFISVILFLITMIIIGFEKIEGLLPLGMIVYNFTLGVLCYLYAYKNYDFKVIMLFRSFKDTIYFIKNKIK